MDTPSIITAKNYRSYLKQVLQEMRDKDSKYSLAYFSRKMNLSDSYMKLVLAGKRELSLDAAIQLAKVLKLEASDKVYFLNLIQRDQAKTSALRAHFADQLQKVKKQKLNYQADLKIKSIFSSSLSWEIYSLFAVDDFQMDPEWIAARLRRKDVTPQKVEFVLKKLELLGVIEKVHGVWKTKDAVLKHSFELNDVYKIATERVLEALKDNEDRESYFDAFCLILSDDEFVQVKAVLEEAKSRIGEIAKTKGASKKKIAYFNSNLFWASR